MADVLARSKAMGGKPATPVAQVDPETGEVVRYWRAQNHAAIELNISQRLISNCCRQAANGPNGTSYRNAGGFGWRFMTEQEALEQGFVRDKTPEHRLVFKAMRLAWKALSEDDRRAWLDTARREEHG